jgi:hypothetical protein
MLVCLSVTPRLIEYYPPSVLMSSNLLLSFVYSDKKLNALFVSSVIPFIINICSTETKLCMYNSYKVFANSCGDGALAVTEMPVG